MIDQVIEGGGPTAAALTNSKFDLVIFTGSPEKGKLVAKAAAENLTPCILELGGKSPTIVDEGANLENAVLRIAQGRFLNSGQTCVSPDYVLAHASVKEEFIRKLKEKLREFFGDDVSKNPDWARIVNENHTRRLKGLLEENHGGKVICGGKVIVDQRVVEPTVIDSPSVTSRLMTEEIFGPILPIISVNSIDEAIAFINKREKPLSLYYFGPVFSKQKERLLRETSSGALSINEACFHGLNGELPFGGVGHSGMKNLHGPWGFDSCSHLKAVLDKLPYGNGGLIAARYPPYTPGKQKTFKLLLGSINIYQGAVAKFLGLFALLIIAVLLARCSCWSEVTKIWRDTL
jgi:aldehyde dehydrogenase (NAD+)